MNRFQPWQFRSTAGFSDQADLAGYRVVGTDEEIGNAVEVLNSSDHLAFVVDTGAWILGQRILLPAGTVESIDHVTRSIKVDRSATDIREAPPYEVETGENQEYVDRITHYYCDLYGDHERHGNDYPSPKAPPEYESPD